MSHPTQPAQRWHEAERRGEIYLRSLRGTFGPAERDLLASALTSARAQSRLDGRIHPVTLVMEALLGFLPAAPAGPMTPPIQRGKMLPEPTEFPVHDWFRRLFRRH